MAGCVCGWTGTPSSMTVKGFGAPKVQRVVGQCGMGARQPGIMHGLQGGTTSLPSVPALFLLSCVTLEEPLDPLALP